MKGGGCDVRKGLRGRDELSGPRVAGSRGGRSGHTDGCPRSPSMSAFAAASRFLLCFLQTRSAMSGVIFSTMAVSVSTACLSAASSLSVD